MNAARLGRLLNEAGDDRMRWAEAIVEEVTDPAFGLVTRDYLDRRFAEFETRMTEFEGRMEARMSAFEGRIEARMAQFESRLMRQLVLTQASGFIAIIVIVLFQ